MGGESPLHSLNRTHSTAMGDEVDNPPKLLNPSLGPRTRVDSVVLTMSVLSTRNSELPTVRLLVPPKSIP